MTILVFSLVLSGLISDVVGSHHGHDIKPSRPPDRRSSIAVDAAEPKRIYEAAEFREVPRTNRSRLIPREEDHRASHIAQIDIATPKHKIVDFVARADHIGHSSAAPAESPALADHIISSSASPAPVPAHSPVLADHIAPISVSPAPAPAVVIAVATNPVLLTIVNPITPPCTPLKYIPPPAVVQGIPTPDFGSHEDELQTPVMQPIAVVDLTAEMPPADEAEQDELQTPLDLNLRAFPPLVLEQVQAREETSSLLLQDPGPDESIPAGEEGSPEIDADSISESQSGTVLSVISGTNAEIITTRAELLRNQAWEELKQLPPLKEKLEEARSRNNIKDAFLLKREIESIEERARKLHERAARRHFHARNPLDKNGEIDVHGLFITEAVMKVENALEAAIRNGSKELRVIVGWGRHSRNGPKVCAERCKSKTVESICTAATKQSNRQGIPCRIETGNPGVLIVTVPS
ncbi:Smr domain-containing protein [Mycena sanguinolenta]|uniref:Smr domain-containing protein n=1 Tax=Mycena sanguinolenta TaxID=230812 RepID=A0A8H6ZEX9_9AGAR|nr:Smr domain-containing protein [Mycena sanguinolenta]